MSVVFDECQLKAINSLKKYRNINAGPGSGKTTTLIEAIKKATKELNKDENILVLTFTRDNKNTIIEKMNKNISQVIIKTIDSFAYSFKDKITNKNEKIITEDSLIKELVNWDKYFIFKNEYALNKYHREKIAERYVKNIMSKLVKQEEEELIKLGNNLYLTFSHLEQRVIDKFNLIKEDFDLLNIKKIFVDECQDLSYTQWKLLKFIRDKYTDISFFTVGDINQSIYEWRNATPSEWQNFYNTIDNKEDIDEINLIYNYRSNSKIINFANSVLNDFINLNTVSLKPILQKQPCLSNNNEGEITTLLSNENLIRQSLKTHMNNNPNENIFVLSWFWNNLNPFVKNVRLSNSKNNLKNFTQISEHIERIKEKSIEGLLDDIDSFCPLKDIDYLTKEQIKLLKYSCRTFKELKNEITKLPLKNSIRLLDYINRFLHVDDIDFQSIWDTDLDLRNRCKKDCLLFGDLSDNPYEFYCFVCETMFPEFFEIKKSKNYGEGMTVFCSKGLEADTVYLFLNDLIDRKKHTLFSTSEELLREIYVGITRAKKNLILVLPSEENIENLPEHIKQIFTILKQNLKEI